MNIHFEEKRKSIIDSIICTNISERSVNIVELGAKQDTYLCQTNIIQSAIDKMHLEGGGTVIIPSGNFLTGSLKLYSNVFLNLINKDSILLFTTEISEANYPIVYSHWEASPCYNYSALIYANNQTNIGVIGKGVLNAQSTYLNWWGWHHQVENAWSENEIDLQDKARKQLRKMNEDGVPVSERKFGDGFYLRPNFIQFINCDRILLEGVTLKNSPMWQLNPVFCSNIIIKNMTLSSHGANSDGCDPESCNNVLIEKNKFETGDDCISLKSGRDRDGRISKVPCKNIVIQNNLFLDGHGGIAFGSEMSGGIENVYAENNLFESPNLTYVLRFKTNAKRGGFIKNVWFYNNTAKNVNGASIHATMLYEDGRNGDFLPTFENITIENFTSNGGDYGIFIEAFPETPIRNLTLKNILITGVKNDIRAMNWETPIIENLYINKKCYPRPTETKILGVPMPNETLKAATTVLGGDINIIKYKWILEHDNKTKCIGKESTVTLPDDCAGKFLRLKVFYNNETGYTKYKILNKNISKNIDVCRMLTREFVSDDISIELDNLISRIELARILYKFCNKTYKSLNQTKNIFSDIKDLTDNHIANAVVNSNIMNAKNNLFEPNKNISREEMATIAMQSCGVSYKNASTTLPICEDLHLIPANYGTNIARSLYFGFMTCDINNNFNPKQNITWQDSFFILNRVADFAGF